MATFPRTEADILELATSMASGLAEHAQLFPSPPVSASEIKAAYDSFQEAGFAATDAAVFAKQRYADKERALQNLKALVKANVRYAEVELRHNPDRLRLIGWAPRKHRGKPRAPGQVMGIEIAEEGPDWISLRWKIPRDGGIVGAYKVQMRLPGGEWSLIESTARPEALVKNLQPDVTLEFKVVAFNKAGEGIESATLDITL
jgi:hypothetical protein